MYKNNYKWLYVVLPILFVAVLGSIFVNLGMEWFNNLNKPMQWIPSIVIPIVWTIIYLTFSIIFVVWINKEKLQKNTKILLIINGVLNVFWCLIFFTFNQTFLGSIIIILNLIAGFLLFLHIFKNNKKYGLILFIYPIWISIATSLNMALWILN